MAKILFLSLFFLAGCSSNPLSGREPANQRGQTQKSNILSAALEFDVQNPLCTTEEFARRIDGKTNYSFSGRDAKGKTRPRVVKDDFLCLMETDVYENGNDMWEKDYGAFTGPCLSHKNREAERAAIKADLVHFFSVAEPYMKNFLCSEQLKRIWIGGEGSSSYSNFTVEDGKPVFALGMKRGVINLAADPRVGMNGLLTWYEQKKTRDGKENPSEHYENGTQSEASVKDEFAGRISDVDGILMNYLYHEYAHFALSGPLNPPAPENYKTEELIWKAGNWPRLSYDWDAGRKFPIEDAEFKTKDPSLQRAREIVCFFKKLDGQDCTNHKIVHDDPNYGELLLPLYTAYTPRGARPRTPTGFISNLSGANPTEQFCEWVSFLSLSRYYKSIQVNLAPSYGDKYKFEIFDEMLKFDRGDDKNFSMAVAYIKKTIEHLDHQLTRAQGL